MKHMGFIMDGNRTWAKNNDLPQMEGHKKGVDNLENVINFGLKKGLEFLSFWALSDDNIRSRSVFELKYLFDLLTEGIEKLIVQSQEKNIRLFFIGDRSLLREDCRNMIEYVERETEKNSGMNVIFAMGYGGQEEIVRAIQKLAQQGKNLEQITKEEFLEVMDSGKFPPPDLIVRTGGHIRHSGYFLFQSAYSEYFFSEKNWPAFDEEEFEKAYSSFSSRVRKF